MNLFLIRWLEAPAYGVFVILSNLTIFLLGLLQARIVSPSTLSDRSENNEQLRWSYAAVASKLISIRELGASALVVLITMAVMSYTADDATSWDSPLLFVVAAVSVSLTAAAGAIKELCIRFAFYTEKQHYLLLANLMSVAIGALVAVAWQSMAENDSPDVGLVTLAIASAFCSFWLVSRLGIGFKAPSASLNLPRENDVYASEIARAGVITHLVFSVRTQGYVYLIPALVGLAAVAELNAARLSTAISSTIIPVLSQFATAFLLKRRNSGARVKVPGIYLVLSSVLVIALTAITFVIMKLFLPGITDKFSGGIELAILWTVFVTLTTSRAMIESEIQLNSPKAQGRSNILGCVVAMAAFYPLTSVFGAAGAVYTLIASEAAVLMSYLWARLQT